MIGDHGPILDKNNIINVRDGESLYQICIKLRRRLSGVPGFRPYIDEMEEREADGLMDPVSSLWQCFRSGVPLLTIYNASQPEEGDLTVDLKKPERVAKEAVFLFLKSCLHQMHIPSDDIFSLTDLYSDNTIGFLKVTKLVNRVLDLLKMSGQLHASTDSDDSRDISDSSTSSTDKAPKQLTRRQHILKELVETERQYVHHLQNLQALKKELEEIGALKGDSIHNIFLNLNNILDFAQRFLIRIEQQNELPEDQQNWGQLFVHYKEPFRQYEPFIANQRKCETTCQQEWEKMVVTTRSSLTRQMLANPTILNGFLLKPFQRLTKYPMLLKDLQNQITDPGLKSDLGSAIAVIHGVLMQADASIDKETLEDALIDLQERIDDWKSLQITTFGELLLLGTFNVMKDGTMRSEEKEYHIYLFSRILIMCKDVNANKAKNKKLTLSTQGKPKMNLKGRIYFTNVTSITPASSPGNYSLQISWKGDNGVDTFIIKFKNQETLRKWHTRVETQRSSCQSETKTNSTSMTQFVSMQDMKPENPYVNQEEEEDYNRMSGTTYGGVDGTGYSNFPISRNGSSTSLRSRSTTGGSGGSNPHLSAGRMRGPSGESNGLPSLNTRVGAQSYANTGASYFSPIEREPQSASTRSSSQAALGGFSRGPPVANGAFRNEESFRNTAPAVPRNTPNGNPYLVNGRNPSMRPSLPPGTMPPPPHHNGMLANRGRSASSPDVHPNIQHHRKYISGDNVPNVPPIPAHVVKQMPTPNRSQNNSPNNILPIRTSTPQQYTGPPIPRQMPQNQVYSYDNSYQPEPRKVSHISNASVVRRPSPPVQPKSIDFETQMPSQLKAKVCYDENYVSMIIPSNIQYQSLSDRIDAKLARFTNHSIASGSVRLRYRDEDGDYILIDSDEAVHEALLDWRETYAAESGHPQGVELLLFAHAVASEPLVE